MAAEEILVEVACGALGVAVSGYSEWLSRPFSVRSVRHAWLTDLITEVPQHSRGTYGCRWVHVELRLGRGIVVGHGAVEMLMRRVGLAGVSDRRGWLRAKPDQVATDLVDREFVRRGPDLSPDHAVDPAVLNGGMVSDEVEHVRRLIDGLRRDRRTDPRRGRREYSRRAREVAGACEVLVDTEPASVPALARRAVDLVTTALMYLDDSSGIVGDELHELMAVHARACAVAPPDPKRLAGWLATLRLDGPGWPDFELRDYQTALGHKGRAELARIVDERASTAELDTFGRTPFGIRIVREQLAEISGDLDEYVAVLAENLGSGACQLSCVCGFRLVS